MVTKKWGFAGKRQSVVGAGKRFLVILRIGEQDKELERKYVKVMLNQFKICNPSFTPNFSFFSFLLKQYKPLDGS